MFILKGNNLKMKMLIIIIVCPILLFISGCSYSAETKSKSLRDNEEPVISVQYYEDNITPISEKVTDDRSVEKEDAISDYDNESLSYANFLSGEIPAYNSEGFERWVTDYEFDDSDWNCYRIGKLKDIDNDGEPEQIMEGPKGGFYLDIYSEKVNICRPGKLDFGEMTYIEQNDGWWILYKDLSHSDREAYDFVKMKGASIEEEMYMTKYEVMNADGETETHYYIDDQEVSMEKYNKKKFDYLGY